MAKSATEILTENAVVKQVEKKSLNQTFRDTLTLMKPEIERALPKNSMTSERFIRLALTTGKSNPELLKCTLDSFLGALVVSAQLGLEPNSPLGQAYIIPYRKEGKLCAQFQLGYKGMITLARRSGEFQRIEARIVHENDEFELEYGLAHKLKHIPLLDGDRGKVKGYYAIYSLKDGGESFEFMSSDDIAAFKKIFVKSAGGPWGNANTYDSMALKTVLKKVLKYAPISTEYVRDINLDDITAAMNTDKPQSPEAMEDNYLDIEYTIESSHDNDDIQAEKAQKDQKEM